MTMYSSTVSAKISIRMFNLNSFIHIRFHPDELNTVRENEAKWVCLALTL